MSAFEQDDTPTTEGVEESFVKKLVESKGEKWSDPEVIAKGKVEADAYIEELKKQIAELEGSKAKEDRLEKLLKQIEQKAAAPTPANTQSNNPGGTELSDTTNKVSEEDIESLVEKTLTKREQENTAKQNIAQVDKGLEDMFGTEAKAKVAERAAQLGLSVKRLQEVAAESPSAFFELMGEKPKQSVDLTGSTIRTEGVKLGNSNSTKNWAYYSNLRKTNPHMYRSAAIQTEMEQQRVKLGDKFY